MLNKCKNLYSRLGIALYFYFFSSSIAQAETIADILKRWTTALGDLPALISILAYCLGLLLVVFGIYHLIKSSKSPNQYEASGGWIRIISGAALVVVGRIVSAISSTFSETASTIVPPSL